MLILSRKVNEKIMIGDNISVSVIEIRGDQVRIGVDAPKTVKVFRQEVYDAIKAENKAAAESKPVLPEIHLGNPPGSPPGSLPSPTLLAQEIIGK